MPAPMPQFTRDFRQSHPQVWEAFNQLADHCHNAGPLDEKSRRLVKVALAMAAGVEGGTHSAIRNARAAGVTDEELRHIAVLAITTIGFPAAMRALSWIDDPAAQAKPKRGKADRA